MKSCLDLDAIDVGAPGYFLGPNVVTIHAADYCTTGIVYISRQKVGIEPIKRALTYLPKLLVKCCT